VLKSQQCDESSDVYSFGVILWELWAGRPPWSESTPMQVVGQVGWGGQRLSAPEGAPPPVAALVLRCFGEPRERPSFAEIIPLLKRELRALGPPPARPPAP
jgi:hypothetical protein